MLLRIAQAVMLFLLLTAPPGVRADGGDGGWDRDAAMARAARLTALGRRLFAEPALSASGRMACASCHDPAHGFTPANALATQPGGPDGISPGRRAVPTLTYLQATPPFSEHYMGSEEDGAGDGLDQGPAGGLTWDGRVDRGRDQARIPLLSPAEMANASEIEVARRVVRAGYGAALAELFGADAVADPARVFAGVVDALEAYEQDPATFFPYSSKYDAFLDGRATLSAAEARGLAAFNDAKRGNCAECHINTPFPSGGHPDFTDFGMIALGVPRNREIAANADPAYFDLGLCGPERADLRGHAEDCGRFKTPTLRNVALKRRLFHNGWAHTLREAVAFYADRDLAPQSWYPRAADGRVLAYDDLPAPYRANLHVEPPFDRKPGDAPALTPAEVDDIVAFLGTLTDGWRPAPGEAPAPPAEATPASAAPR